MKNNNLIFAHLNFICIIIMTIALLGVSMTIELKTRVVVSGVALLLVCCLYALQAVTKKGFLRIAYRTALQNRLVVQERGRLSICYARRLCAKCKVVEQLAPRKISFFQLYGIVGIPFLQGNGCITLLC